MKKRLIAFCILLALFTGCVYVFIPARLAVTNITTIRCTRNGAYPFLAEEGKWQLWWPVSDSGHSFFYKGFTYRLTHQSYTSIAVSIQTSKKNIASRIAVLPINKDSIAVKWSCDFESSVNPFKRLQQYRQAIIIKENMTALLASLESFLEKNENIYGTPIYRTKVTDTLLVATKESFNSYPTTMAIYSLVNRLKKYIMEQGAVPTGYPMLNILQTGDTNFETMTAIPINRVVKETNSIFIKRMVPGNILVTEARGGISTVSNTFHQLEKYVSDYRLESPAIPFQSLVTDRSAEPDTTKWITKLYYPVY